MQVYPAGLLSLMRTSLPRGALVYARSETILRDMFWDVKGNSRNSLTLEEMLVRKLVTLIDCIVNVEYYA